LSAEPLNVFMNGSGLDSTVEPLVYVFGFLFWCFKWNERVGYTTCV
jgi:hypothetical protein